MPLLDQDQKHLVTFDLNGKERSAYAEPRMLLSDFLRNEIGLSGVHVGCEHGVCGCCTVNVDGKLARSCMMYAVQIENKNVKTVEGLAGPDGELSTLQKSFKRHHALQCGYCTTGILMSATSFLEENSDPSEDEVRDMLSGHICRCTGYTGMVKAILDVAQKKKNSE
jgi:2-furoyl-CoA dehydrogenase 2Fe-2S iron sulfur subunit